MHAGNAVVRDSILTPMPGGDRESKDARRGLRYAEYHEKVEYLDRPRQHLRWRFLECLEALAPEVLEDLRKTVLPAYGCAKTETEDGSPLWPWVDVQEQWRRVNSATHPLTYRLGLALVAWAQRHHLSDNWLLEVALSTANRWHEQQQGTASTREDPHEPIGFVRPLIVGVNTFPSAFTFTHDGWVPTWETRANYVAGLEKALKEALRAHLDNRETEVRNRGLKPSPLKREVDRDLDWLIRRQVQGWTWIQIQRESRVQASRSTIRDSVGRMADELGLTLRHGKSGRPPSSK